MEVRGGVKKEHTAHSMASQSFNNLSQLFKLLLVLRLKPSGTNISDAIANGDCTMAHKTVHVQKALQ